MGIARGPNIVTKDLVMAVDCDAIKSYPGSGTTLFDLTGKLLSKLSADFAFENLFSKSKIELFIFLNREIDVFYL